MHSAQVGKHALLKGPNISFLHDVNHELARLDLDLAEAAKIRKEKYVRQIIIAAIQGTGPFGSRPDDFFLSPEELADAANEIVDDLKFYGFTIKEEES